MDYKKATKILVFSAIGAGLVYLLFSERKGIQQKIQDWIEPVSGKITSYFGMRIHPITKKETPHNGIDIGIPSGTPLRVVMDGEVTKSDYNKYNGNFVKIKHTNGYSTIYLHLSERKVKVGDKVKQGQLFALSGNTGQSTGSHLHLEVEDNLGVKVNPLTVFKNLA